MRSNARAYFAVGAGLVEVISASIEAERDSEMEKFTIYEEYAFVEDYAEEINPFYAVVHYGSGDKGDRELLIDLLDRNNIVLEKGLDEFYPISEIERILKPLGFEGWYIPEY